MAELFLAQDEPEAPLVVIKRILPYLSSEPEFVRMFLDEARIAAQLHHPNIVQVHELGKLEESIFIAMEYVEGVDLRKMLQQEQKEGAAIDYAIASRIVADVCAGLHYAHHCTGVDGRKMEIVHRDISPQNVMVGFDGRVKLVDFGIARANAFMERSQPGVLKGKFLYLSPEQVMQEPLDHRSDLFAIGTLLYEITTGKTPFQRPTPEAVIFAVRREDPPSPQLVRADYPPELSSIVARCLAKDRTRRYQDASEIQADLEAFLARTRPVGPPEVAEYAQLLFGDDEERTILNIPQLQGSSQATLIAPPVLARPPTRRQEPRPPPAPPQSGGTVSLRRTGEQPASDEPALSPNDATPLFTPRPQLDLGAPTHPGRTPRPAPPPQSALPIDERDTGEVSLSLATHAVTESSSGPAARPSAHRGLVLEPPLPPVIVSPPVPRRPTRIEQVAGAPPPNARRDDFTNTLPPEPTGSTTQALPPRRTALKTLLFLVAAVGLVSLGIGLGRMHGRPLALLGLRASPPPSAPAPSPAGAAQPLHPAEVRSEPAPQAPPASPAGVQTAAPSQPAPEAPAPARVVFHLSRGAVVELGAHRVRSGSPVTVAAGRLRYRVHCSGHSPVERHAEVSAKSAKPQVISVRCPAKPSK